jgi:superfamily II DNA helicase RecQ
MTAFGLEVVVINSNTCAEARSANKNLWIETCNKGSIIVLSPEELQNSEFRRLIDHPDFCKRICKLGIDEIHLLHWWGKSFQPAFQQVGFLRPRLPSFRGSNISLIGTTATLRKGRILNNICELLGLKPGSYHRIQRSNMQHDIQLISCCLLSMVSGKIQRHSRSWEAVTAV